jgi:hypothetical protein
MILNRVPFARELAIALALITFAPALLADHTADPASVAIVGSLQDELGCPGDWQPECPATELASDPDDDVWQETFALPAGSWEYKAALNDSWDENYGEGGEPGGANIPLDLGADTDVKFYYDHKSHWITDNVNSRIATAVGDFQDELGCPGDWQPDCLRSWLQDPDGDGTYTFSTDQIPAGNYEAKVAIDESWDESYGAGGGGDNIPFEVPDGATVHFFFESATNIPDIVVEAGPPSDTVAIVGDLQSELGCPDDCSRRLMVLQGGAERQLGRELPRRQHSARSRRGHRRKVLLRSQIALGYRQREFGDRHGRGRLPGRIGLPGRLAARLPALLAAGPGRGRYLFLHD